MPFVGEPLDHTGINSNVLGVGVRDEDNDGTGLVLLRANNGLIKLEGELLSHSGLEGDGAGLRVIARTINGNLGHR